MITLKVSRLLGPSVETATLLGQDADRRWVELDNARRLPDDLYEAALAAGLFRTLVPAQLGGPGTTPLDWFRIGMELAWHEPSLGWVVTQGAAELGWLTAGADPAWATEVLADPLGSSATTIAGLGELTLDGPASTIAGQWAFDTGCTGATWIGGLCLVAGSTTPGGLPEVRFGLVPAERAQVHDDWNPTGLRGTGSHSTTIATQTIDPAWTFSPFVPTANDWGPHRCLVGNGNWPIATSVAATQLGAARRALDEAKELLVTKAPAPEFVPLARNAAVQRAYLRAEGLWHACRAGVEAELVAMWDEATRDEQLSTGQRARLFAANATANEQAVAIIETMCELTGTASLDRSHPLSRCRRDAQVLRGHLAANGQSIEYGGQVALGVLAEQSRV
ncbi:MAG: acyl-CoA dehydrogenase family protein [Acidimicrobiales bacterium]